MLKTNLGVLLCAAMIVPAASVLRAEKPQEAPAGPIPSQVLAAQKIFIANGGGDIYEVAGIYNEFYADMKAWGHYQLVGSPSEADLILEISRVNLGTTPAIKLELRDPKANTLLWTLDEMIRKFTDKGNDEALDKLFEDLKALIASPAAK